MADISDTLEAVKFYKAQYGIGTKEAFNCVKHDREVRKTYEEVCSKLRDTTLRYRPSLKTVELLIDAFEQIDWVSEGKEDSPQISVDYSQLLFDYLTTYNPDENQNKISDREILDWERNKHTVAQAFKSSQAFICPDNSRITGQEFADRFWTESPEDVIEYVAGCEDHQLLQRGVSIVKDKGLLHLAGSGKGNRNTYARAQREGTLHYLEVERRLALNYILRNTKPEYSSEERVSYALEKIGSGIIDADIQLVANPSRLELMMEFDTFIEDFGLHEPFSNKGEAMSKEDIKEQLFYLRSALRKNKTWLGKVLEN